MSFLAVVILIGIDGLSGEGMQRVDPPALKALMARGAGTLEARAVPPTVSSPNWATILTGAPPAEHGVLSNAWEREKRDVMPVCSSAWEAGVFPTLAGLLRTARKQAQVEVYYDWDGFGRLLERRVAQVLERRKGSGPTVEAALEKRQERGWPDLLILHLDDVDHAGHEHGWRSAEYDAAVRAADALVGRVAAAAPKDAVIAVVSDHGGWEKKHGGTSMLEFEVPFIVAGPGIRTGVRLRPGVSVMDVTPTLARLLGVGSSPCWRGKALEEALTAK